MNLLRVRHDLMKAHSSRMHTPILRLRSGNSCTLASVMSAGKISRNEVHMSKKKIHTSVKDAFGNDIHVGDQVVYFDKVYGRLAKSHVTKIINKSRIAVVSADMNGEENTHPPFSWMSRPLLDQVGTKKVMLCPLDQWNPSKGE